MGNYTSCIDYKEIETSADNVYGFYSQISVAYGNTGISCLDNVQISLSNEGVDHDNCFKSCIESLDDIITKTKEVTNGLGDLVEQLDETVKAFKKAEDDINDTVTRETGLLNFLGKLDDIYGISKENSLTNNVDTGKAISFNKDNFEKNLSEDMKNELEEKIAAANAEITSIATSATGVPKETEEETGALITNSFVSGLTTILELPQAILYLSTMKQPVGPLSNEGYRDALIQALKEKYPKMSDTTINKAVDSYLASKQKTTTQTTTTDSENQTNNTGGDKGTSSDNRPPDRSGPSTQARQESKQESNAIPQKQDNTTQGKEESPSTNTAETPTKEETKEPTIIEEEEKVPETPPKEENSTGTETSTPPSNNNNQTNTDTTINTNPSTGTNTNSNNNYVPNNNSGGNYNSSSGGNYNSSGNSNAPVTNAGTPNENASTTTPSAPESDAGITDKTGETLDVISIDKNGGKASASTSSNDGGSVVPTILGVGVAGAAAVAGAKIIHDRKQKSNEYSYEEDTDNNDNSFSNLETYTGNDTEDTSIISPEKYKAGSANDLVLESAPADIKIDDSIANIPNQKEELE